MRHIFNKPACGLLVVIANLFAGPVSGADRLVGIQSARVLSQSLPWIAEPPGAEAQATGSDCPALH